MTERSSKPKTQAEFVNPDEARVASIEAANGLLQFDRLMAMIDIGIEGRFRLRLSQLMELNRIAVQGLVEHPGSLRQHAISISGTDHEPPESTQLPELIEELCDYVNDNWSEATPIHLASYIMWRLNWVHPFSDGNGRTSRAVSYLVLCVRLGFRLPGTNTIPDRIADNKDPYYAALDDADARWKAGLVDMSVMEKLLEEYLAAQLVDVVNAATRST